MGEHDGKSGQGHGHEPGGSAVGSRQSVSPGKRALTMSLPPRAGGAPPAPVQMKSDPAAEGGRKQAAAETASWTEVAMRPDLHGEPVASQRAPGAVVQRSEGEEEPQEEPPVTRVSNRISEPPYGWTSSYDVQITASEVRVTIKVKLVPQAGVSEENVADVQQRTRTAFREKFDNQFIFTDGETEFAVRTDVQFVDSGEHMAVNLHPGNSRSNRTNWSVERPSETYAHELGHQLGLLDEYVDSRTTNRATAEGAGVHTDHSIMGNIHSEGRSEAATRQRHGETIAGHINAAVGRTFTVRRR